MRLPRIEGTFQKHAFLYPAKPQCLTRTHDEVANGGLLFANDQPKLELKLDGPCCEAYLYLATKGMYLLGEVAS